MKKKFIDFEKIKNEVHIERVAEGLGMTRKGAQYRGECPACGGADRSLVVTPDKNVFYCFNAQEGGDLIALYAHAEGLNVRDAAAALEELYCTRTVTSNSQPVPERRDGKETQKLQPLSYLDAEHEAVLAVGFDPSDAETLGIGYAMKGIMRGTVAVPVRMEDGTLVGYIGITEATLPPSFKLQSNVDSLRKKTA